MFNSSPEGLCAGFQILTFDDVTTGCLPNNQKVYGKQTQYSLYKYKLRYFSKLL